MYQFHNCESSSQSSSETDIVHSPCTCCKCKNNKQHLIKGKFGLAYIVETPKGKMTTPLGWQIEFEDTPSGVIEDCNKMVEWVSDPPLKNCRTCYPGYPSDCAKILKCKQNQCCFKCDIKDNCTNTTYLSCSTNCCDNSCNCAEPYYNCCGEKSTQNPSRKSCCYQKSRPPCDNQYRSSNRDLPMHYQGCYWYRDKDTQHCWYTTQDIGMKGEYVVETKDDSTSYHPDQSLDYVPSRERKNNSGAQIIRVKNRETQYQDGSTDFEEVMKKNVSDKQVGTKEGFRVSIDDNRSSSLNENSLERLVSLSSERAKKDGENSSGSLKGIHSQIVPENSLEKIVSSVIKENSFLEKMASSKNKIMKESSGLESEEQLQNESSARRIKKELSQRINNLSQREMAEQDDKLFPMLSGAENLTSENFLNVSKSDVNLDNLTPMQKLKMAMKARNASKHSRASNELVEVLSSVKQEKSEPLGGKIVPASQSNKLESFVIV